MKWNKAGRPRKKPKTNNEVDHISSVYTKEELKVCKNPVVSLAAAVVRQWKEDGCPSNDVEGIQPWISIIKSSEEQL